jgi:hypothetical protein
MKRLTEPFGKAGLTVVALALACLLVPAAQAFANGTATVEIEGTGKGEVLNATDSLEVLPKNKKNERAHYGSPWSEFQNSTPLVCSYNGATTSGTCTGTMNKVEGFGEREGASLIAIPSAGSEFVEWTVVEGVSANELLGEEVFCRPSSEPMSEFWEEEAVVQQPPGGEIGGEIKNPYRICVAFNESSTGFGSGEDVKVMAVFAAVPAPTVTGLSPTHGPAAGANTVTIEGTNLENASEVDFGGSAATITSDTATEIEVEAPAGTAGETVDVTVTTPGGTSATGAADEYTYDAAAIKHTLGITVTGSGAVKCKVGAGPEEACAPEYNQGTALTLVPKPSLHFAFTGWSGGTGSASTCSGTGNCSFNLEADSTVTATFEPITHTLTVTTAGSGNVSAATGAISGCETSPAEGTCSGTYNEASKVKLTATPKAHQKFKEWSGPDKGACTTATSCEVTIPSGNAAVTATFEPITHTLTVTKAGTGSGSVTCNGVACVSSYAEGTEVTLAASAASGSTFAGWSGGGCSGTGSCKVTIEADTAVTATFNANPVEPEKTCANTPSLCPPPPPSCVVPKLAKKTLGKAKAALSAAHCALGKVSKPKAKKGHQLGPLVVKSSSPGAGTTLPAGSKVNLKLGPKPKAKKKH